VLKDVIHGTQEAEGPPPRKKVRTHLHFGQLRAIALNWQAAWDQLMAVATWRAEELRATDQHRPFDQAAASTGYEASPWKWGTTGRKIQVQVGVLWSWRVSTWQRQIVHAHFDHLLERSIPVPSVLGKTDGDVQRRLKSVAAAETATEKATCKYIGLHIGAHRFKPDPSKLQSPYYPARRAITKDRLDQAAAAAAQTALQNVLRKTGAQCDAELHCTYCGPVGDVIEVAGRTQLMFHWELSWKGLSIFADTPIRSDKAIYSGLLVPPRSWTYILIALSLPRTINEFGGLPWMREGDATVECTGLAMAKPSTEPPKLCVLFGGGMRIQHLVLARTDDFFLCSTGVLTNPGGIVRATPERVWSKEAFPHTRLRGRIQRRGLEELVTTQPQAYTTTLAVAHLMVAEEKGGMEAEVRERLLTNPLQWDLTIKTHLLLRWRVKAGAKWRSHVHIVSLSSVLKELQS